MGRPLQMVHPDRVMDARGFAELRTIDPVYPATEGLTQRIIGKAIVAALARAGDAGMDRAAFSGAAEISVLPRALSPHSHTPEKLDALEPMGAARRRLAYDELLASQLALVMVRSAHARNTRTVAHQHRRTGRKNNGRAALHTDSVTAGGRE